MPVILMKKYNDFNDYLDNSIPIFLRKKPQNKGITQENLVNDRIVEKKSKLTEERKKQIWEEILANPSYSRNVNRNNNLKKDY